MTHFIRNKLSESLMFRAGYTTIPADGAWHEVDSKDVVSNLFKPAVDAGQAELQESEHKPTDVVEIVRPHIELISVQAVAQGLSLEEYKKYLEDKKNGTLPVPPAVLSDEENRIKLPSTEPVLTEKVKAALATSNVVGGMSTDEYKAFLEKSKTEVIEAVNEVEDEVVETSTEIETEETPVDSVETADTPKKSRKAKTIST